MRIPEGKVLGSARGVSVREAVQQAMETKLTGYLVVNPSGAGKGGGIIVLDEGRILHAADETLRGEEAFRKLLPMTADIVVHELDDIEMVLLIRMLRIEVNTRLDRLILKRENLLKKYGIKEPSPEYIDAVIRRALEG